MSVQSSFIESQKLLDDPGMLTHAGQGQIPPKNQPAFSKLAPASSMSVPASQSSATTIQQVTRWVQAHFVYGLLAMFGLAFLFPQFGQQLRHLPIGIVSFIADGKMIDMPVLLLAIVLFNAGLGIRAEHFKHVCRKPLSLGVGVLACWAIPLLCLLLVNLFLPTSLFENSDYATQIWIGLVLVTAMPVANMSSAWTQNAHGNLFLCLSLVLATTLLSPIISPWVINGLAVSNTMPATVFNNDSARFLFFWVICPSLLGWLATFFIGQARIHRHRTIITLINCLLLFLLNYINASTAFGRLDDGLQFTNVAFSIAASFVLCGACYLGAFGLANALHMAHPEKVSLVYTLGMKNVGVALTFATAALPLMPFVGLLLICYVLTQHFIASLVQRRFAYTELHPVS